MPKYIIVNTHRSRSEGSNTRDELPSKIQLSEFIATTKKKKEIKNPDHNWSKISIRENYNSKRKDFREKTYSKDRLVKNRSKPKGLVGNDPDMLQLSIDPSSTITNNGITQFYDTISSCKQSNKNFISTADYSENMNSSQLNIMRSVHQNYGMFSNIIIQDFNQTNSELSKYNNRSVSTKRKLRTDRKNGGV